MNNALSIAAKGKGVFNTARRAAVIMGRYGITAHKMDGILAHFAHLLDEYDCGGTFPLVAAALSRSRGVAEKYQGRNFEYAIHGYYHIDHQQLSFEQQAEHFSRARLKFESQGLAVSGLRCPYLRWNGDTLAAIQQAGLLYDSSQVIAWNVAKENESESYRRVLGFYGAVSADEHLALPRLEDGLVRIPYCVPDDEALIDRLRFGSDGTADNPWLAILRETHRRGELFTLGLHPERIHLCEAALRETLHAARQLRPSVWFARLDVISRWWLELADAQVQMRSEANGLHRVNVSGPKGVTLLARNVDTLLEGKYWDGVWSRLNGTSVTVQSEMRPVIGIPPASPTRLSAFLRQQGYIVETMEDGKACSLFIQRESFGHENEKALVGEIEKSTAPLVRLSRWPDGAHSALCVTGDIDALTIWDYYLRFVGR